MLKLKDLWLCADRHSRSAGVGNLQAAARGFRGARVAAGRAVASTADRGLAAILDICRTDLLRARDEGCHVQ